MKRFLLPLFFISIIFQPLLSQQGRKPLNHDAMEAWKRITETVISPDGKYVAYKTEPWKGDTELFIYNSKGEMIGSFLCGSGASFTFDSGFLVFDIAPGSEKVRELRIQKTKKDEMPLKSSAIYNLKSRKFSTIERCKSIRVPGKWSGTIAWQPEPEAGAKKDPKQGNDLYLLNPVSGDTTLFPSVTFYAFANEAPGVIFVSAGKDESFEKGLYVYNPSNSILEKLSSGAYEYKQVIISDDARGAAFLAKDEEAPVNGDYALYYWNGKDEAKVVADNSSEQMPEGWRISENGRLQFSGNKRRLFLGTAPSMPEKDTLRLDDEYPDVDIWHGSEGKMHTVQVLDKTRDQNRTWMAVVDLETADFMQVGTLDIPEITLIEKGNSDYVLAVSNVPYELQAMWEGSPEHYDAYLFDLESGERKLLRKDIRASFDPSPAGKYIAWYDYMNESIYAYDIEAGIERRITSPDKIVIAREDNDVPNPPSPYRQTGWLEDDSRILVNDRYDIWMVDPLNLAEPVNLTVNGRETRTAYNNISLDREKEFFIEGEELLLEGINEVTRESGFYSWTIGKPALPRKLIGGQYSLSRPVKSRGSSTLVYSVETFEIFPDLMVSDLSFRKSIKISDANPQQKEYNWGTAELYSWTSLDGRTVEGLLYKPADFDPTKKYPMIVNFYEKSSSELFSHRVPELHRSTVDYHYYTSNGYLVFNPDVYYETGYPGESAYNCVMPGVTALIGEGFVDGEHVGAQGHSWGGYQVAYLATRTDLFAAIESGAPVVNMFSAYGGIRWWTGLSRSFQYEHTQSRIGATIWESPLRYIENSPLFTMDKVTTPILIMHNDADGHVPWYQGIEYFTALRRLGKPVWMLNYTGEPHWPQNLKNKKDFQIRMAQFFDHYLKGKPMPRWMDEGIPVIMKEYDLGYDLVEK